jgi:hypothetical protein
VEAGLVAVAVEVAAVVVLAAGAVLVEVVTLVVAVASAAAVDSSPLAEALSVVVRLSTTAEALASRVCARGSCVLPSTDRSRPLLDRVTRRAIQGYVQADLVQPDHPSDPR